MNYDTVFSNGTLVTPEGLLRADLAISGERIAAIGPSLDGRTRIDATGMLVIPGGIDPHVHLQMPAGPVTTSDDWTTGTVAAACGGTTTVIDFVEPGGTGLMEALAARRAEAEGRAAVDFALHMTLQDARPSTLAAIPEVSAAGCRSFKTYLTYEGFKLTDAEFLSVLEAVAAAGGLALVHAENDAIVRHLAARFLADGPAARGRTEPAWHARSRPAAAEGEAVERALSLAEVAGCRLYVVHVSTARGADAVKRARDRGRGGPGSYGPGGYGPGGYGPGGYGPGGYGPGGYGPGGAARAIGETCPQYLLLTDAEYERPGFEGAKFVCSPPLRTGPDTAVLWERLAAGDLSTVGTDHCPFFYVGQKDLGRAGGCCEPGGYPPFNRIPGGMPGIESRLALLYTYGVGRGRLSLERWVEVCCTEPGRVFGLSGRKGALAPGADADIVLFDPERKVTVSRSILHEHCDYTPYEGCQLTGYPVLTMLRGRVIARDGKFCGGRGGRFLHRQRDDNVKT